MKKLVLCTFLIIGIFLTCACESKEKIMNCSGHAKNVLSDYEFDSSYKVHYKGNIVNKIEYIEEVTSDSEDMLNYFENHFNDDYSTFDEAYGGYTFAVKKEENKVISNVTVDYTELDTKKLLEDQPSGKNYFDKEGNLTTDGVIDMYEAKGITCDH